MHCLRKAWVWANCGPLPLIYWVFVMPVLVCLLVSKHPVCGVHAAGRSCSMWLMQDTVPGQWVKGRFLGQDGQKYFASFSPVQHKGIFYSRSHQLSFCKIVSLWCRWKGILTNADPVLILTAFTCRHEVACSAWWGRDDCQLFSCSLSCWHSSEAWNGACSKQRRGC